MQDDWVADTCASGGKTDELQAGLEGHAEKGNVMEGGRGTSKRKGVRKNRRTRRRRSRRQPQVSVRVCERETLLPLASLS